MLNTGRSTVLELIDRIETDYTTCLNILKLFWFSQASELF